MNNQLNQEPAAVSSAATTTASSKGETPATSTATTNSPPLTIMELRAYLCDKFGKDEAMKLQTRKHSDEDTPIARTLDEFVRLPGTDPAELLKHRYLCRGGGLLLVGPTGHGKSSLAMQLMIKWALGQPVFGLEPTRPLKSLLIQAENDDGDLAEMKCGVFNGLSLSTEEQERASKNIMVCQESGKTGAILCDLVIEPLLETVKPDLLWIDPALAYLGADMNNQKDVGAFLRNRLNPLLQKFNCAVIIIHHTNKINKDPEKQMTDFTYMGAGSAEWSNWSRAIIALNKTDVDNLYELIAAKRGTRLKWRTADGESLTTKRYIGHSKRPDTICWMEMAIAEAEELKAGNGKNGEDVLKHVPQDALIAKDDLNAACRRSGIGKNRTGELINELIENDQLYEHPVARPGKRAKILLGREVVPLKSPVALDLYERNSQGHYLVPAQTEPLKKEL